MASDENTPSEIQRAIAAETRDHRRLMLDEWRLNVQTSLDTSVTMQSFGKEYAQIGLKSAFLANAGALVALPPLMQWLSEAQRSGISGSAWWFLTGLALAAVCSIIAYANFMILGSVYSSRASASAVELAVHYGLRDKAVFNDQTYIKNSTVEKRLNRWVLATQMAALATGILSYVAFLIGVFEFKNLVMH